MKRIIRNFAFFGLAILACPYDGTSQWSQAFFHQGSAIYCFADSGSKLFAGASNGFPNILLSLDHGQTWQTQSGTIHDDISALAVQGQFLFAAAFSGIYRSTDDGRSWMATDSGLADSNMGSLAFLGRLIFAGGAGIFRSTDSGGSWVKVIKGLTSTNIYSLVVCEGTLFAGTDKGLFSSSDSGSNWKAVAGLPGPYFAVMVASGSRILVSTDSGLFLSTDAGSRWQAAGYLVQTIGDGGRLLSEARSLAISGPNLFAAISSSYSLIFMSTDDGVTWVQVSNNFGMDRVQALCVSGPNMVAGSGVVGIGVASLADLLALADVKQTPTSTLVLSSNPNPITSTTAISFTLPSASQVTLTLTDAAGRERQLLPGGRLEAGQHQVTWDASNYPSGVYLCRLSAGGESVSRRVVVLH